MALGHSLILPAAGGQPDNFGPLEKRCLGARGLYGLDVGNFTLWAEAYQRHQTPRWSTILCVLLRPGTIWKLSLRTIG